MVKNLDVRIYRWKFFKKEIFNFTKNKFLFKSQIRSNYSLTSNAILRKGFYIRNIRKTTLKKATTLETLIVNHFSKINIKIHFRYYVNNVHFPNGYFVLKISSIKKTYIYKRRISSLFWNYENDMK